MLWIFTPENTPAEYQHEMLCILHTHPHWIITVRPNRKGMLKHFGYTMKMKMSDLKTKVKGNLTATV
jgi:actin-like ATPase involved in cell morphogenesis